MSTPLNFVVIMKELGRGVCLSSQPVMVDSVSLGFRRMVLSMSRRINTCDKKACRVAKWGL
ncbi:MAG: hypothetical protein V1792_11175 [Pseudomonadota bacterium]